ncbi:MAG TPA: NAD(P)/FAD-dependent oxidoreductase [Kofleriaceae bacterium]|jgi:all-trans-retinol 13,14-reductase|nr:NAD(P)/FAD-dependent oxidoreductase [Kofleriaceae bacterium]
MRIGRSYKQHGIPDPGPRGWDTIVIGSGLGGLATASLLARHRGQRVLVLERHYTAGGFTHTFHRPGYEWDVGVHYVGDVHRPRAFLRRLFDHLTDGELGWADLGPVYDQIVMGDDVYDFVAGRDAFRERMHGYFPREKDAIDRYLARVREAVGSSKRYFLEKALPPAIARVAGPLLRRNAMPHARATVADVMRGITRDPRLAGVLTGQYGDYGLPPSQASFFMHAMLVDHYLKGAAYPIGGSARFAETMLPSIERAGGAVMTSAEVERIVVEKGRAVGVRLAGGEEIRGKRVVSDAGIAVTYGRLLDPDIAREAGARPTVAGVPPSFAHLSLYVGLDRTATQLGLARANQWVYPGHDHDRNVARYVEDGDAPLPVAYLSFPSAKDPDFERRHPGKGTIEVIGVAPWERFARWDGTAWKKRGADYETVKRELADRLMQVLLTRCPQLEGHIAHAELSTPLSTKQFASHPSGEIYGLAHNPARFEARELRVQSPIAGLYLTGADVVTAGVGGAVMAGVLTATVIAKRNLLSRIVSFDSARRFAPGSAQDERGSGSESGRRKSEDGSRISA